MGGRCHRCHRQTHGGRIGGLPTWLWGRSLADRHNCRWVDDHPQRLRGSFSPSCLVGLGAPRALLCLCPLPLRVLRLDEMASVLLCMKLCPGGAGVSFSLLHASDQNPQGSDRFSLSVIFISLFFFFFFFFSRLARHLSPLPFFYCMQAQQASHSSLVRNICKYTRKASTTRFYLPILSYDIEPSLHANTPPSQANLVRPLPQPFSHDEELDDPEPEPEPEPEPDPEPEPEPEPEPDPLVDAATEVPPPPDDEADERLDSMPPALDALVADVSADVSAETAKDHGMYVFGCVITLCQVGTRGR